MKKYVFAFLIMFLSIVAVAQQSTQYSQYMFHGLYINPAYAGYRGTTNIHTYYRSQWTNMSNAPRTLALAADMRTDNDKVGLGLNVMSDKVGLEKRLSVYANYAYRLQVGADPDSRLSFGLGVGMVHSGFDNASARTTDPEAVNIENTFLPDARFGVFYNNHNLFAGIGVDNLISNMVFNRSNSTTQIPPVMHYYFTFGGLVPLSDGIMLKPSLLLKDATKSASRAMTADFNAAMLFAEQFTVGVSYRTALSAKNESGEGLQRPNSVIVLAEFVAAERFRIGYSFDYMLNRIHSQVGGTHEISLGYALSKSTSRMRTPRFF